MRAAPRAVALAQGSSYVYFASWAFLRRRHYVERHELAGTSPWVLNAHAGWMALVGAILVRAGLRGEEGDAAAIGLASAASLAANDLALSGRIAPIYRVDLAWEALLASGWIAVLWGVRE